MTKLDFDDDFSRLLEEFNVSPGAVQRRKRILAALDLNDGIHLLDVGSGPGHLISEIARAIGADGHAEGLDSGEGLVEIARRRCAGLANAAFTLGDAYDLPYEEATFDVAMSSQVFEYLDDVPKALREMFRVLKPAGRVLIHGTGWGALLWHSGNPERMAHILKVWEGHLADPRMCETMASRLYGAGFTNVQVHPIVHVETEYDPASMSAVLSKFIAGYANSEGISQAETDDWAAELRALNSSGEYFFSSNEYIFTGNKP